MNLVANAAKLTKGGFFSCRPEEEKPPDFAFAMVQGLYLIAPFREIKESDCSTRKKFTILGKSGMDWFAAEMTGSHLAAERQAT